MQKWVYNQGWSSLHDVQEQAIPPIIAGQRDVILSAATAAGKTEAAFLPILSAILNTADEPARSKPPAGAQVLCLSPLKALINDQYRRLQDMCGLADIAAHRWHGDVPASAKKRFLAKPSGVLLITPESLEAMLVIRGTQVRKLLEALRYIVIDEMHAFLSTARGAQIQSLMNRVEMTIRRRPPRVGLSATLGDMTQAAWFIRPTKPASVELISSSSKGRGILMQLRGYVEPAPVKGGEPAMEIGGVAQNEIADHLYARLRGKGNLIFANARRDVETYADLLSRRSDQHRVPNEFWPHHGSLSKSMRETVEKRLKDTTRPATAVCTSTLEMGIDIGAVASVAQVGPPPSVASLLQRLGRSGRRGDPSILRMYVIEREPDDRFGLLDELRCSTVRAVSMIRLMLGKWIETPDDPGYNYSTLIQQILSAIAQHGGATPVDLYRGLCGPGPFHLVDQNRFVQLLRTMSAQGLVVQNAEGELLHGEKGEPLVNHYTFYASFATAEEWRLTTKGRPLGSIPISQPLHLGMRLIFGGKRWMVQQIDSSAKTVEVEPSTGGKPPMFTGSPALVSDRVRSEMVEVYKSLEVPTWIDETAGELLAEGRDIFARYRLARSPVVVEGDAIMLFPWVGDRALFTMSMMLGSQGIEANVEGPSLLMTGFNMGKVARAVKHIAGQPPPDAAQLAEMIANREIEKWDWVLTGTELSEESAGARLLDIPGAMSAMETLQGKL